MLGTDGEKIDQPEQEVEAVDRTKDKLSKEAENFS